MTPEYIEIWQTVVAFAQIAVYDNGLKGHEAHRRLFETIAKYPEIILFLQDDLEHLKKMRDSLLNERVELCQQLQGLKKQAGQPVSAP